MQKEISFLLTEQNQSQLLLSDLRDKLRKREDELQSLKQTLNTQLTLVDSQYHQ